MRSTSKRSPDGAGVEDRTTRARIRDAAIECFAEYGIAATTARRVAAAAGVSPGSVIHHFGSMEGLRAACDEHIVATVRAAKRQVFAAGPNLDVLAAFRGTEIGSLAGYLARVLADDSPSVARLVDDLVSDAEGYLAEGVANGMVRPADDPRGRAVVMAIWSLGALVLHRHLDRLLGVDLSDPEVAADPAIARYVRPAYEIVGRGLFTEEFTDHLMRAFDARDEGDHEE